MPYSQCHFSLGLSFNGERRPLRGASLLENQVSMLTEQLALVIVLLTGLTTILTVTEMEGANHCPPPSLP